MMHSTVVLFAAVTMALATQVPPRQTPGTWIVQIEGDAATLKATAASHKPFAYRARRGLTSDYRVSLVDSRGVVLATAPLDLSKFCVDSQHRGQPPHVRGDVVVEHKVVCRVKVPALADAARVQIEDVRDAKKPVLLGTVDRKALLALVEKHGTRKVK